MDPADLAATAMTVVSPYLAQFGADAAKEVASAAGKSVWDWIKGKLTSPAGQEAVAEFERAPTGAGHKQMLESALTTALAKDPAALAALAKLLGEQGIAISTQTATVTGDS